MPKPHRLRLKISAQRGTLPIYNNVLTLEQCKQTLNKGTKKYTNEEVKAIRDYLYLLAGIELEHNQLKTN